MLTISPLLKHWYNEISCFIFKEKFENSICCDAQAVQVFVGHSQICILSCYTSTVAQLVEHLFCYGMVVGSIPPKTLEMVLTALSLGAQHYGSRARDQNGSYQCQYIVIIEYDVMYLGHDI